MKSGNDLILRRCAAAGVVLVFAVIVASAYLRLAQAGLGCTDWPACYGPARMTATASPEAPTVVAVMRLAHRIAAAGVGFVVIAIAALCLTVRRRDASALRLAGALVASTVFLALLGRATPGTQLPAVTLGNLLGGMTMLALMEWLRLRTSRAVETASRGRASAATWIGVALIAFGITLGALTSANYAGASCPGFPDCQGKWWPASGIFAILDPWRPVAALPAAALIADPARQGLHLLHRIGSCIVLLYWIVLAAAAWNKGRARAATVAMVVLLLLQFAVGAAMTVFALPLALAVAHNALAALIVIAAVNAAFQSKPADVASVSAACQIVTSKWPSGMNRQR